MTVRNLIADEKPLSLKDVFETEFARRDAERRAKEAALRRQQEADLAGAGELLAALTADPGFLESHGLVADHRCYTVSLDHERFRITAYFENGAVAVTHMERASPDGATSLRGHATVQSLPDALRLIAQFLLEETC
jgi:hypothetical protein